MKNKIAIIALLTARIYDMSDEDLVSEYSDFFGEIPFPKPKGHCARCIELFPDNSDDCNLNCSECLSAEDYLNLEVEWCEEQNT